MAIVPAAGVGVSGLRRAASLGPLKPADALVLAAGIRRRYSALAPLPAAALFAGVKPLRTKLFRSTGSSNPIPRRGDRAGGVHRRRGRRFATPALAPAFALDSVVVAIAQRQRLIGRSAHARVFLGDRPRRRGRPPRKAELEPVSSRSSIDGRRLHVPADVERGLAVRGVNGSTRRAHVVRLNRGDDVGRREAPRLQLLGIDEYLERGRHVPFAPTFEMPLTCSSAGTRLLVTIAESPACSATAKSPKA